MTENKTAQPGLTDDEIDQHLDAILRAAGSRLQHYSLPQYRKDMRAAARAIESALLSKLRAEGVQAGDERMRNALQTLVDMYVLNQGSEYEQITCYTPAIARDLTHTQRSRNQTWKAWDAARTALASAPVAGEAVTDEMIQAGAQAAREYFERTGGNDPAVIYRAMRAAAPAAPQASAEPLARYCPGCGSVGPVGDEYRDCCPDGNQARMIPARLAEKCRDTFRLAIQTLLADAADNDSAAPQAGEAVRKQALHQAADLVESFGRDAGAGRHFESSSYEAVVPAASNEISKLIRALADRPAPPAVKDGAGSKEHQ